MLKLESVAVISCFLQARTARAAALVRVTVPARGRGNKPRVDADTT
jgi:hypothetical protein